MQERKVLRLKDYDYSSCGYYYITLLTKNRECHFGQITNDKMILNEYGAIAKECWERISEIYSFINIDEHIIMPNHIHGLIEISSMPRMDRVYQTTSMDRSYCMDRILCDPYNGNNGKRDPQVESKPYGRHGRRDPDSRCDPYRAERKYEDKKGKTTKHDRTKEIIPKIIQLYKSAVTKKINELNKIHFQWHKSYYDHIVRDEEDLNNIRKYIVYNALKWKEDKNHL